MMDGLIGFGESVLPHLRDSVWQVTALIAVFFVVARLFCRRSLTSRYWLWVYCLVGILLLPGISFLVRDHRLALLPAKERTVVARPASEPASPVSHVVDVAPMAEMTDTSFPSEEARTPATAEEHSEEPPSSEIAAPKGVVAASTTDSGQPTQPTVSEPIRETASPFPWRGCIALVWMVGCAVFLLRLVFATGCIARIRRSARAVDDPSVWELFEEVKRESGSRNRVRLRIGQRVSAPVSVGIFRPTILLPESLVKEMPPEQLRPILLHELAHVRWNDYAVNLFQRLAEAILFFHPFVHLMNRSLRRMREEMCDNWVLSRSPKATVYARALTALAEKCLTPRKSLVGVGLFHHPARLRQRIERILACGSPLSTRFRFGTALTLLVFSLVAVGSLSLTTLSARAVQPEDEKAPGAESENVSGGNRPYASGSGEVDRGQVPESGSERPPEMIVELERDGSVVIDGTRISLQALKERLGLIAAVHPDARVVIRADSQTPYREVARTLQACTQVNLQNISFAVKHMEKKAEEEEARRTHTLAFLENLVKDYQNKVRASSEALQKFKAEHIAEFPGGEPSVEADLKKLMDEFEDVSSELSDAQAAKKDIENQIREVETTIGSETVPETNPLVAEYRAQLGQLEQQLATLRSRFTDQHPEILSKTEEIERVKSLIVEAERTVVEADPVIAQYKAQLDQAGLELAKLQDRFTDHHPEITKKWREIESLKALIKDAEEKVRTKESREPRLQYEYLQARLKIAEKLLAMAYVKLGEFSARWTELGERVRKSPALEKELVRLMEKDALNRSLLVHYTKQLENAKIEAEKRSDASAVATSGGATPAGSEEVFVYVEGEVNKPGVYTFTGKGQPTLYRAIIMAGGFADYANQRKVVLIRTDDGGKRTSTEVDVSETIKNPELDPAVQSDDIIHVPRKSVF